MKEKGILTGLLLGLTGVLVVPAAAEEVQSYKYEEIQDAAMGKVVARCMIPSDYAAAGQVTWCGPWQSAGAPAQVYITALSPDQNTVLGYYSPVVYEQMLEYSLGGVEYGQHQDGAFDGETLTPMLQFMEAEAYCDYVAETILSGYRMEFLEQHVIASELQQMMEKKRAELQQQMTQLMAGTGYSVDDTYAGMAERSYAVSLDGIPFRMTILAETSGSQISATGEMFYAGTFRTSYITWEAPLVFFMLTPEQEYEKNAAVYEQFVWNTELTDQFVQAFTKAKDQIISQMRQSGSTSMDSVQDYCESSVSASMGSGATYDAEQFSDYILSQNDYTMPDGEHVKVSNTYDYVYADDLGNLYVSNTQEQPEGTAQLYPN